MQILASYAAMVDDQHIFVVGVPGMLGGGEGAGDYNLAVNHKKFMMKIIEILGPADVDSAVLEDTVAAPGTVLTTFHCPFNVNPG